MRASELIMAKALEYDDFRLTKIAHELHGTEQDVIVKTAAGPLVSGVSAAVKGLFKNNVVRNTAIGAGTGALGGAVAAEDGSRLKGTLKGAALGGAVGGVGTFGMNVSKTMGKGKTFTEAFKQEGKVVGDAFKGMGRSYDRSATAAKIMEARKAAKKGEKVTAGQKTLQDSIKATPNSFGNTYEKNLVGATNGQTMKESMLPLAGA